MKKTLLYTVICVLIGIIATSSCSKDFLNVEYTDGATEQQLQEGESSKTALASVAGIYAYLVEMRADAHDSFGLMSILHSTDMMSGDIAMYEDHWFGFDYKMDNRMAPYRRTSVNWTTLYSLINKVNEIIDLVEENDENAPMLGQAYALRGMAYDYLIQLYQKGYTDSSVDNLPGVPMRYAKKEGTEDKEGRNTVKEVLEQARKDLEKGVALCQEGRSNKTYINKNVAYGLLARHYLLSQAYEKAYEAAKAAFEGQSIEVIFPNDWAVGKVDRERFVSIDNPEWMWGFDIDAETATTYASFFSHISNLTAGYAGLGYAPRAIDANLYSKISDTDIRKTFYHPKNFRNYKFGGDPNFTQDYMYMRSPEMILIQAEALAHLGKNAEAAQVLKVLMERRDPDWNETSVSVEDVYLQRRIELWGEGFSYFDMKRLGIGRETNYQNTNHPKFGQIEMPAGNPAWTYQIPRTELQENNEINEEQQNP